MNLRVGIAFTPVLSLQIFYNNVCSKVQFNVYTVSVKRETNRETRKTPPTFNWNELQNHSMGQCECMMKLGNLREGEGSQRKKKEWVSVWSLCVLHTRGFPSVTNTHFPDSQVLHVTKCTHRYFELARQTVFSYSGCLPQSGDFILVYKWFL